MTSIVPPLATATTVAVSCLSHLTPLVASRTAVVGSLGAVVVVMAAIFCFVLLAAVASAARSLVTALAELARLGSALLSALLVTALVVLVLLALLLQR
jgi:hypothetical protein